MSYQKARHILPMDLLEKIQEYVDGEYIYIPRAAGNKREWGSKTAIREEMELRNKQIYTDHTAGFSSACLARKYFLSLKSIQRIIRQQKRKYKA